MTSPTDDTAPIPLKDGGAPTLNLSTATPSSDEQKLNTPLPLMSLAMVGGLTTASDQFPLLGNKLFETNSGESLGVVNEVRYALGELIFYTDMGQSIWQAELEQRFVTIGSRFHY